MDMKQIELNPEDYEQHKCKSVRVGNEMHYFCEREDCNYVRVFFEDGTTRADGGEANVMHSGFNFADELSN